jgi:hypothetical protein
VRVQCYSTPRVTVSSKLVAVGVASRDLTVSGVAVVSFVAP